MAILLLIISTFFTVAQASEVSRDPQPPPAKLSEVIRMLEANKVPHDDRLLGQVYALAYLSGDTEVPMYSTSIGPRPNLFTWSRKVDQRSHPSDLPLNAKLPLTEDRKAYLQKALTIFEKRDKSSRYPSSEFAWALFQAGRKAEARRAIKPVIDQLFDQSFDRLDSPSTLIALPLGKGAKTLRLVFRGAQMDIAIFPKIIERLGASPALAGKAGAKPLDWAAELKAYVNAPGEATFAALKKRIENDLPADAKVEATVDSLVHTYSRADLLSELERFHGAHLDGAARLDLALKKALTATKVSECRDLFGAVSFTEGEIEMKALCGARLAWTEKTWGHCRELFRKDSIVDPGFNTCVGYLAYRSKEESLCAEVHKYLQSARIFNFDPSGCRARAKREVIPSSRTGMPGFHSDADWKAAELVPSFGGLHLELQADNHGRIAVGAVRFHENFWERPKADEGVRFSALKQETLTKDKAQVSVISADAKVLKSVELEILVPPTDASFGPAPADFKLEEVLKTGGNALNLYYECLDQQADKLEIEKLRQQLWISKKRGELLNLGGHDDHDDLHTD